MDEELLEETEWTVEGYLALFDPASPDYALLRERSSRLRRIVTRRVRAASGAVFEDTEFTETTGISYTVRARL